MKLSFIIRPMTLAFLLLAVACSASPDANLRGGATSQVSSDAAAEDAISVGMQQGRRRLPDNESDKPCTSQQKKQGKCRKGSGDGGNDSNNGNQDNNDSNNDSDNDADNNKDVKKKKNSKDSEEEDIFAVDQKWLDNWNKQAAQQDAIRRRKQSFNQKIDNWKQSNEFNDSRQSNMLKRRQYQMRQKKEQRRAFVKDKVRNSKRDLPKELIEEAVILTNFRIPALARKVHRDPTNFPLRQQMWNLKSRVSDIEKTEQHTRRAMEKSPLWKLDPKKVKRKIDLEYRVNTIKKALDNNDNKTLRRYGSNPVAVLQKSKNELRSIIKEEVVIARGDHYDNGKK